MTLIKGGRGDSGEKKDGSVSTLGKSSPERLEDSWGNSSVCWTGKGKIGENRERKKGRKCNRVAGKNNRRMVVHLKGVSRVIPSTFFTRMPHARMIDDRRKGVHIFKCFHSN